MGKTFGEKCILTRSMLEGNVMSFLLKGKEVPNDVGETYKCFVDMLIKYIDERDDYSKSFLELCNNHIDDIHIRDYSFIKH